MAQWWGSQAFTNRERELDVRPGGTIRIHMRAPVYPLTGVYQKLVASERFVFMRAALDKEGDQTFAVLGTVTFAEQGG